MVEVATMEESLAMVLIEAKKMKILTVMVMVVARIVELMQVKEKKILTVFVTVVARFVKLGMMRKLLHLCSPWAVRDDYKTLDEDRRVPK